MAYPLVINEPSEQTDCSGYTAGSYKRDLPRSWAQELGPVVGVGRSVSAPAPTGKVLRCLFPGLGVWLPALQGTHGPGKSSGLQMDVVGSPRGHGHVEIRADSLRHCHESGSGCVVPGVILQKPVKFKDGSCWAIEFHEHAVVRELTIVKADEFQTK